MATQSFKEKLTSWEVMSTNLRPQLDELPHMVQELATLEELLAEGRILEAQQGMHTAALRETNRKRLLLEQRGDELRERMSGSLRGKLGAASKRLHEFGVKPKAERRRRLTVEQKLRQLEVKKSRLELQKQKLLQEKPAVMETPPEANA